MEAILARNEEVVDNKNIVKQKATLDIRKHFYSHRVVDHWNNLPSSVKNADSVNDFKNLYDALPK